MVHFLIQTRKWYLKRHIYNKIEVKLIKMVHVNVILGHKVKTQKIFFGGNLVSCYMFLGQFFRQEREKWPYNIVYPIKVGENEKYENYRIFS